ncbi:proton channel OtopLc-like [Anneissia japonica]|uniref:proton channel OtopLc-like n=1 Tax=Anneissia japonica TaxID=1529436 RepID=UPI001425554E|nr:proton channel OtopLc-like [Anneissia japonica]
MILIGGLIIMRKCTVHRGQHLRTEHQVVSSGYIFSCHAQCVLSHTYFSVFCVNIILYMMAGRLDGYWMTYNTIGLQNDDTDGDTPGRPTRRFEISSLLSMLYGMSVFLLVMPVLTVMVKQFVAGVQGCASFSIFFGCDYIVTLFIISEIHMVTTFIMEFYFRRTQHTEPVTKHMEVNAYVKLGLYVFAGAAIAVNLLILIKKLTVSKLYHINSIVFFIMQVIYLQRYSRVCFQKLRILNRFGIIQILVTNLSHWVLLVSYETYIDYVQEKNGTNITTYDKVFPYLMDCTVEYCLIAAALLGNMWRNIGRTPKLEIIIHRAWTQSIRSSIYGIFAGILIVVAVSFIGICLLNISATGGCFKGGHFIPWEVYFRIGLASAVIICVIYCALFLKPTSTSYRNDTPSGLNQDGVLLLCCVGVRVLQDMFSILAAVVLFTKHSKYNITLLDSLIFLTATLAQSTLIILGHVKRSVKEERKRTVQNILLFLSITNFSLWTLSHYELKNDKSFYPLERRAYGSLIWYLMHHVTGPVISFYYFHSAACLFELWIAISHNT